MKARVLPLAIALALIVLGGAAILVGHLRLASAPEALPSGAVPSGAVPPEALPSEALPSGAEQVPGDCTTVPHACGFPDATNTGVPSTVHLSMRHQGYDSPTCAIPRGGAF